MNNSINLTLPTISMKQPTEGEGYIIVARDLLQGVEVLSPLQSISPRGCALIAAHALECVLKAFLWHKGTTNKIHDIGKLWGIAYEKGLDIPKTPPTWVEILDQGHKANYYFRYQIGQAGTVVHAGQTPALIPMAVELRKLMEIVERAVGE